MKPRWLFYLLLASPGLIPIVAPYLPFQDWPAQLGLVGGLLHLDDPAARIEEFYTYKGALKPNIGVHWLVWLFAQVLPPMAAANLVLALFVGALGPSMAFLCRAVGADEQWAFLSLPLALGRHLYCGFASNAAALPFFVLAIGLYFVLRSRGRWMQVVLLWVVLVVLHRLHAFVYLATGGLLLLAIAYDLIRGPRRPASMGIVALSTSLVVFVPHWMRMNARAGAGPSAAEAIIAATKTADRSGLPITFWKWLFASYRYSSVDDVLQGIWCAAVVVIIGFGVWSTRAGWFRSPRFVLAVMAVVTAFMFALLPSYVGPPLNWWGGNLRLAIMVPLLLIPLAPPVASRTVARCIAVFCVGCVMLAAVDLNRFHRNEMGGFAEVLDAIEPGKKISVLHWTPRDVHEYPGEPHGYASNYYLFVKGGFVPQNIFEHPDMPFGRKVHGAAPPWGQADFFDWQRYGEGYDGFLVRIHDQYEHSPLHGPNQAHVELVVSSGKWRYYRKTR